ncbi:MAG: DUF3343 domain-containing protein [Tissierellales bacterium]|jgi:hypothetical protein|nr:DUF3343 domain-containing protein [Tissierellales bacterium]
MDYYVLFPNHMAGLTLEKHLKNENLKYDISPTPRVLSVSCGISIKINKDIVEQVSNILSENKIPNLGIKQTEKKPAKKYFDV